MYFFAHRRAFLFWPRVCPRALGCGARRGGVCTHGVSLGPGWDPWRALWAFKSRELARNHGIAFRRGRASQDNGNFTVQLFLSSEPHGNNSRFELSLSSTATDTAMRVWTLLMCVSAACATCVRVRGSAFVCWHSEVHGFVPGTSMGYVFVGIDTHVTIFQFSYLYPNRANFSVNL